MDSDSQVWEGRKNEQLTHLYWKESIVQFLKGARMEWVGHVCRAEISIDRIVLVKNINKKKPRCRPKQQVVECS